MTTSTAPATSDATNAHWWKTPRRSGRGSKASAVSIVIAKHVTQGLRVGRKRPSLRSAGIIRGTGAQPPPPPGDRRARRLARGGRRRRRGRRALPSRHRAAARAARPAAAAAARSLRAPAPPPAPPAPPPNPWVRAARLEAVERFPGANAWG